MLAIYPLITLVTGPRTSGRTTFAVLLGADSYMAGFDFWHNGTATFSSTLKNF